MSINPNPAPEPFPIWVVWREDQPAHGYFATEDIAKRATIDYWEEDEPVCPDYSWRRDGPRWELVVGGEHGGVYASRHLVYGGAPAAVSVVPPATNQAALRERIAEALVSWTYRGKEPDPGIGMLETVRANAYSRADAVLAVLPAPVDRAAVRAEAFDEAAEKLAGLDPVKAALAGQHAWNDAAGIVRHMARQERRLAAEAPHTATPDEAAELLALVRDFLDPDPCSFDHHGYCQAHAAGFGGEPLSCPHGRARKLLEADPAPTVVAQPGKETDRG